MQRYWAVTVLASILIIGFSQQAFAVPTVVTHSDLPSCDPLLVPTDVDELGWGGLIGGPFPPDEEISYSGSSLAIEPACPSTDGRGSDIVITIVNHSGIPWPDVWYVADPESSLSNIDGTVNGAPAFKIDAVGINTPLVSESLTPDGVFEPGESWDFIVDDYTGAGISFISIGVPSVGSGSFQSIIAFNPAFAEGSAVGGTFVPLETTSLLVSGASANTWMIPVILAAIGIAVFVLRKNS